jgi:hypothetical protein
METLPEVQDGLNWLSLQPHRDKIFVAGNHDVLLDEAFLERYPERKYGQYETLHRPRLWHRPLPSGLLR